MPRQPRSTPRELKRVQFDLSPKSLERLKRLQHTTEASSYAEVVRTALKVYEFLLEQTKETGPIIAIPDKDGTVSRHINLATILP